MQLTLRVNQTTHNSAMIEIWTVEEERIHWSDIGELTRHDGDHFYTFVIDESLNTALRINRIETKAEVSDACRRFLRSAQYALDQED